jgi:hypothetical protein
VFFRLLIAKQSFDAYMKKSYFLPVALAALAALLIAQPACYYDNEEELYPGSATCDTAAQSFASDILPIIDNNCSTCHAPGGEKADVPFTNHAQVSGRGALIVSRINDATHPMPPTGPMLDLCLRQKIAAWVSAGAPNN